LLAESQFESNIEAYSLASPTPAPLGETALPLGSDSASQPLIAINVVDPADIFAYVINSAGVVSTAKANAETGTVTLAGVSTLTAGQIAVSETLDPSGKFLYVATYSEDVGDDISANPDGWVGQIVEFPITNGTIPATGTIVAASNATGSTPVIPFDGFFNETWIGQMVAVKSGSNNFLVVTLNNFEETTTDPGLEVFQIGSTGTLTDLTTSNKDGNLAFTPELTNGVGTEEQEDTGHTCMIANNNISSGPVVYLGTQYFEANGNTTNICTYSVNASGNITLVASQGIVNPIPDFVRFANVSCMTLGNGGSTLYAGTYAGSFSSDSSDGPPGFAGQVFALGIDATNGTLSLNGGNQINSTFSTVFPLGGGFLATPLCVQSLAVDSGDSLLIGLQFDTETSSGTSDVPASLQPVQGNLEIVPLNSDGSIQINATPTFVAPQVPGQGLYSLTPVTVTF